MKLAIFGASGATGRHLVKQALDAGHDVRVLLRRADGLPLDHPRLSRIVGGFDDAVAVQAVVRNADAVVSVLGSRKGAPATICTDGVRSILPAMQAAGVRRLIALSAYGALETSTASWFIRFVRSVIADKMRDKDSMELLVRDSDTDWTLVRPPALTNGQAQGRYRAGAALRPGLTGHLSRADLAAFILATAQGGSYIRAAPVVTA